MSETVGEVGLPTGTETSSILLEAARPDLFRLNAFRVTELPVDASPRDLNRRQQMVDMAASTDIPVPSGPGRALPLETFIDPNAIAEAMQRLRDPERRLVDEFFWFWPQELGQGANDEALALLAKGDITAASNLWLQQERFQSEANVSIHNLAVLAYAKALDLEWVGQSRELTVSEKRERVEYWEKAYQYWRDLINYDGFWSRLSARIRDLDDPRLTTGTARRMRASLPLALLSVNARLAVRAAERKDIQEARRHIWLMQQSGFEGEVIEEAIRRGLEPVREAIRMLCKTWDGRADMDPQHGDEAARKLMEQAKPMLGVLDSLLAADNPTRDGLHDEVAQRVLACVIPFGNETGNWQVALELLEQALPIAVGDAARSRIEKNMEIARGSLEYATCWFCKKRPSAEAVEVEIQMYGEVKREYTYEGSRLTWRELTVNVPRCHECNIAHAQSSSGRGAGYAFLGGALGFFSGVIVISAVTSILDRLGASSSFIGGASFFVLIGTLALAILGAIHGTKTAASTKVKVEPTQPLSTRYDFPAVKKRLDQGWKLGLKPPEAS